MDTSDWFLHRQGNHENDSLFSDTANKFDSGRFQSILRNSKRNKAKGDEGNWASVEEDWARRSAGRHFLTPGIQGQHDRMIC